MRVSGKHNDLENVGPSLRHHTFFEMLGNFSFGDYFKQDAIALAWRLLTEEWGLDPARLRVTVFKGDAAVPRDEEAYRRWRDFVPAEHIGELGVEDNFWAMGDTGPCGRCSEIYVDRGPGVPGTGDFMADIAAGSERFVEIWNNVFMEFDRNAEGVLTPLPARSIDTGMGLERIAAVMQGTTSNYDTALFTPLLEAIGGLAGRRHGGTMDPADVSMRVIADHMRAMTFLIADGVVPSNEWRGYVLRKIMRRAMRHGRRLGLESAFLYKLVDVLVAEMGAAYPELVAGRDAVVQVVHSEEDRFEAVLTGPGIAKAEKIIESSRASWRFPRGQGVRALRDLRHAARLHRGPRRQRRPALRRRGLRSQARAASRSRPAPRAPSTAAARRSSTRRCAPRSPRWPRSSSATTGSRVRRRPSLALLDASLAPIDTLPAGADGFVVLGPTPFYLEAGGQVSDTGALVGPSGRPTRGRRCRAAGTRTAPRPPRARRRRAVEPRHDGGAEGRRRAPRGDPAQPHRARTCCMPRCARPSADTSSRPGRWSLRIGCASTSSTPPPSRRSSASESNGP